MTSGGGWLVFWPEDVTSHGLVGASPAHRSEAVDQKYQA